MLYKIFVCLVLFYLQIFNQISACLRTINPDFYQPRVDLVKTDDNNQIDYSYDTRNSSAKFFLNQDFPFFGSVLVSPSQCMGSNGEIGICVGKHSCKYRGSVTGRCALGYGVCCFQSAVCNSSEPVITNLNQTHLTVKNFQQMCRYEIPRPKNVCQIRLDFLEFKIDEGPRIELYGECSTDTFMISGTTNAVVGSLCGDLKGQHMYLDYGNSQRINLDFYLKSELSQKWDILLTTIKCGSPQEAPDGCLQYFTAQRDTVKSFNFNLKHQINNQEYSICVRTNPGMKKITWKTCGYPYDFVITGDLPALPPNADPSLPADAVGFSISGSDCVNDWVMFLGVDKYCGNVFPSTTISTTSQPFIVQVNFNSYEIPHPSMCPQNDPRPICKWDIRNTGFCLEYTQSV